ncbi:MAG: NAD(P)/FAD-dependent oxidoreductase [Pyrinomonadaceae bacterium]
MHDVVIIGAGPAGIAAALWCDQLGLDTLILEERETIGGQLLSIYGPIENYPGLKTRDGRELLARFSDRIDEAGFDLWTNTEIETVDLAARRVCLRSGETLQSIGVVIATGVRKKQLGIPGEEEFANRGLIESAVRDRHLLAGKDVCVIGGGDAAVENALILADVCATVTLVHRGKNLRARREFVEQLQTTHCVTVFAESVVTRLLGNERLEAVEVLRKEALKPFQMAVQGVLIRIGVEPNTELFHDQLKLDEKGFVETNSQHETTVPNVFAIGDVSNPLSPTISSATGAGATAAKVIAARLSGQKS